MEVARWSQVCASAGALDCRCSSHVLRGGAFCLCAPPLWLAVYRGEKEIVEVLLKSGASADAVAKPCPGGGRQCEVGGQSALHLAVSRGEKVVGDRKLLCGRTNPRFHSSCGHQLPTDYVVVSTIDRTPLVVHSLECVCYTSFRKKIQGCGVCDLVDRRYNEFSRQSSPACCGTLISRCVRPRRAASRPATRRSCSAPARSTTTCRTASSKLSSCASKHPRPLRHQLRRLPLMSPRHRHRQ